MTLPCPGRHDGFEFPAPEDGARFGLPGTIIDSVGIGALVGAAVDGCPPCQDRALDRLVDDPLATVRLVELAAVMVHGDLGGVPESMTTEGTSSLSEPFRRLIRAGLNSQHVAMFTAAQVMTSAERRAAADDALDLLVGRMVQP